MGTELGKVEKGWWSLLRGFFKALMHRKQREIDHMADFSQESVSKFCLSTQIFLWWDSATLAIATKAKVAESKRSKTK